MKHTLALFALASACSHAPIEQPAPLPQRHVARALASIEVVFHGEQAFGKRGDEEWSLGDVPKSEMAFSPDGRRFAYVRPSRDHSGNAPEHMVVRDIAGDPVNEFPLYRRGKPESVAWIDERRLGYLAPAVPEEKLAATYVVHDVQSGEVLQARSGTGFVWGPERRHVAFVTGAGDRQSLVIDGRTVWPRRGTTRLHLPPVWSPDGHGIAVVDQNAIGARLVVLVEYDDPSGDLTWPVPKDAISPGLRVFWANDSKVVIGETALHPRFAAGWERVH